MEQEPINETTSPPVSLALISWGLASVAFSTLCIVFNTSAMVLGASFSMKLLAVIVGSILGLIGALIGDAIRKLAHPEVVYTNGGIFSLIWIKIFWRLGPQVIGLVIGVGLGCSLVLR